MISRFVIVPVLVLIALPAVGGEDDPHEFLAGLRERRLFSLAASISLGKLAEPNRPPAERMPHVEQLARTYIEQGRFVTLDEQRALWREAEALIERFRSNHPDLPQTHRLDDTLAELLAVRAEFRFWEALLAPGDREKIGRAIAELDTATERIRELLTGWDEIRRKNSRGYDAPPGRLTNGELWDLAFTARYRLAGVLLDRAELEPAGRSRDRFLSEVGRLLEPLTGSAPTADDRGRAEVGLLRRDRLRGDTDAGLRRVTELESVPLRPRDHTRWVAEHVRLLLAANRPAEASRLLLDYVEANGSLPGELAFLRTRVLIALWEAARERDRTDLAETAWRTLADHLNRIEQTVGGFWAYRSRLLAAPLRDVRRYGVEVADRLRSAREAYSAGQTERSAELFETAAASVTDSELKLEVILTAASIRIARGELDRAVVLLLSAVETVPNAKRVPEAHLLAVWCRGQDYERQRTTENRVAFVDLLRDHLARFPDSPTAGEASWMWGRLEESRLQRSEAITHYRRIPETHARRPLAEVAIARCYEGILDFLRENNRDGSAWGRQAITELSEFVPETQSPNERLTLPDAEVMLRLARIHLRTPPVDFEAADRLLDRISRGFDRLRESEPDLQTASIWEPLLETVLRLRVLAFAGRGELVKARDLLTELADRDVGVLLGTLDGLTRTAEEVDPAVRSQVAMLQLQAARALEGKRGQLTEAQRARLDRSMGQALIASRQPRRAVEVYEEMLKESPNDPELIRKVAGLLVDCGTPECFAKAKPYFVRLERGHRPGSDLWFDARYHVILSAIRLGQKDEAAKLLRLTRLLNPDLPDDWVDRFAELDAALK